MPRTFELAPDESIVLSTDKEVLTLTTHRVRFDSSSYGESELISIPLHYVASAGLVTKSYPSLLVLGFALIVTSLFLDGIRVAIPLFPGLVSFFLYWPTRQSVLSISSSGGHTISAPTTKVPRASAISFLDSLESHMIGMPSTVMQADVGFADTADYPNRYADQ
jgi:hypothetical protein